MIEDVFTPQEVRSILATIEVADAHPGSFRKTRDLFAIRRFLREVPGCVPLIFTEKLRSLIREYLGADFFVVKSIYFDKPPASNWFVAWHQDLTISVDKKADLEGFKGWTVKQGQFAVQPPLAILESIYTIRIHLDDTDEDNGALRVIPGSHRKGVIAPGSADWTIEQEVICPVPMGGVMIMRPLLLHASSRSTNDMLRRVIHIEFSSGCLPEPLSWAEQVKGCTIP